MKNTEVITYFSPNDPIIDDVCNRDNVLHVCATTSLTNAMADKYKDMSNVIAAKWFVDAYFGEWMEHSVKLKQAVGISEIVRRGSASNPEDKSITQAIRRNKEDVLLTIRMLSEMGIKPSDLEEICQSAYEKELIRVWKELIIKNETKEIFNQIYASNKILKNPPLLKNLLSVWLKDKYDKEVRQDKKLKVNREKLDLENVLVLHGFYFLTPIQQSLFNALRLAGVKIIFLQFYKSEFPSVFSFIEKSLGESNGWVPVSEWKNNKLWDLEKKSAADYLASIFENKKDESAKNDLKRVQQYSYKNIYEWVDEIERSKEVTKNETKYVSVLDEEVNQKLKEFFPERFEADRSLLTYPIGQYLLHLHKIWNQERKREEVNAQILKECFISPWLFIKIEETNDVKSASDFVYHLEILEEYFPQKMSLNEWKQKIATLANNIEEGKLLNNNVYGSEEKIRFLDEIKNPTKKIAPFNIPATEWWMVHSFIEIIEQHVQKIFNNLEEKLSFKKYFSLLAKVIDMEVPNSILEKSEREVLQKIREVATGFNSEEDDSNYYIEDIAESITLLISGKLDKTTSIDREEENIYMVGSLERADGLIFLENCSIHISGMDEFSFPNHNTTLPWPLTLKTVKKLIEKEYAFNAMVIREEYNAVVPRFLLYTVLSGKQDIVLSWFENINNQIKLKPSFYLDLLRLNEVKRSDKNDEIENPQKPTETLEEDIEYKTFIRHYSEYATSELNICQKRFFYSYITQPFSTFKSEFHQGFLYENLYQVYKNFSSKPDLILNQLFPYWTNYKYSSKAINASSFGFRTVGTFEYGGEGYQAVSGLKYLVQQPQNEEWQKAWNHRGFDIDKEVLDLTKASPGVVCKFCPHESFCPDALYSIDEEGER